MAMLEVDEASIRQLIEAFDQTQANCDAAGKAVEDTRNYLEKVWQGDASARYSMAVAEWQSGLEKVKAGLAIMNEQMAEYHKETGSTEDSASSHASWT
ncbi:WXG100 family type VII secretion target [Catellatospora citrea]|uniref:ESAT-6-like protein n=1 Tax=Catellatospora citrea TaxID=53366 RepID=A0A8J3KTE6_9ACTN|nr:WXG100 family type VII secretion target [Catellatospora citrea]RKE10663.1 WXG100 family type VII secretion target [Catellatospora citrea]GIG03084.1 hypothetical protein Cci01nite_81770 [Catellatospora citrea]